MAKKEHKELPIPNTSQASERAIEVLRVWINKDGTLDATCVPAFKDPALWGLVLTDIARYVSRAYASDGKIAQEKVLDAMRDALVPAWNEMQGTGGRNFPQPN